MLKRTQAEVDPRVVREAGNNPNRMEPERFAMLVEAVKRFGFLQPMLVRPDPNQKGGFVACDGHHRLRAAQEAGLTTVPVVVVEATDAEADALQVSMNRLRGDLDLAATAEIIAQLKGSGWGLDDLNVLGFSDEELSDLVAMTESHPDILPEAIEPPTEEAGGEKALPTLEVVFDDPADMRRARRALKKAAGKGGSLAQGLLNLLDAE